MTSNIPSTNSLLRAHPERKSGQEAYFLEIVSDSTYTKGVLSRARRLLLQREVSFDRTSFVDARDCYQVDVAMLSPYENKLVDHYQLTKGSVARVRDMVDDAQECYIQEGWEKSEQEGSHLADTLRRSSLPASTQTLPSQNLRGIPHRPSQTRSFEAPKPKNHYRSKAAKEHATLVLKPLSDMTVDHVVVGSRGKKPEWFRSMVAHMEHFGWKLGHIFVPETLPMLYRKAEVNKDDDEDEEVEDNNDDDEEDEDNEDEDEDGNDDDDEDDDEGDGEKEDDDDERSDGKDWMLRCLKGSGYLISVQKRPYSTIWRIRKVDKLEELHVEGDIYWCGELERELNWWSITL